MNKKFVEKHFMEKKSFQRKDRERNWVDKVENVKHFVCVQKWMFPNRSAKDKFEWTKLVDLFERKWGKTNINANRKWTTLKRVKNKFNEKRKRRANWCRMLPCLNKQIISKMEDIIEKPQIDQTSPGVPERAAHDHVVFVQEISKIIKKKNAL